MDEVSGKPYGFTEEEWYETTDEEKQKLFAEFRERLYAYWRAKATYEKEQAERREERRDRYRYK